MKENARTKVFSQTALVILCLAILSGCNKSSKQSSAGAANEYKVLELKLSDKSLTTSYSASIRGRQDVEIRPQVSGLITKICVREGEKVHKGQLLFVIDQVAYRAALETAQANVEAAQANVETARLTANSKKELYDQEVVSAFDWQTAQNSLKSAEASLAQAKAQQTSAANDLSYTEIKSPSDGIVGTLPYRIGALVNSTITTPLTTVSDNSEMYVYFSITENHVLSLVRQYGSLDKTLAAMPVVELGLGDGTIYGEKGKIESISGVIDQTTGAVSLRAVFPNQDGILLSGGAGNIIYPYDLKDILLIPQAATYELQDKIFVYKVVDGIAQATEVKTFETNDGTTYIVESGLKEGDVIVAEGAGLLKNETPITPVKE